MNNSFSDYIPYTDMNHLINDNDKCLLIAPHPDDDVIGCGGILYKHRDKFDCICTNSSALIEEANRRNINVDDIAEERMTEFNNTMKKLNIKNYWIFKICGERPLLYKVEKNFKKYLEVLDFKKYDKIFVPYRYDSHREHRYIANRLVPNLIRKSGYKDNSHIVYYEVWSSILDYNYFEDISDVIEIKRDLINTYVSRLGSRYADRIIGLNCYRGLVSGVEYAEAFKVVDIDYYLSLNDNLDWNK